jgi:N utilization substance protein B
MKKTPGSRREGRALAVQLLFMLDHNSTPFEEALPGFMAFEKDDGKLLASVEKSRVFCEALVRGVIQHKKTIDRAIKETTANFALNRIGGIERSILRLAIYEMHHCPETPPVVSINEAVELAKRFSGDEAGRFVNGVLDKIRTSLSRPARTAAVPIGPLTRMEQQMQRAAQDLDQSPPDDSRGDASH